MHEKVNVLAKDVARLRDELKLYRLQLNCAIEQMQEGTAHSRSLGAISIRGVAELLAIDIAALFNHHLQQSQGLGNLIGQIGKVPNLTCQSGQVKMARHTWVERLGDIKDIVGGAPHPWVPLAPLDSLVHSVTDLLKILQELYCEDCTPPIYRTIFFDVAPILMAYKESLALREKRELIPLDTTLISNADVTVPMMSPTT